jgi:hypothetical protein
MPRVFFILFTLLAAATVDARDIYVNNVAGDDRHQGDSERSTSSGSGPCRTITRALRAAERGDQIILANTGVPYREAINIEGGRNSGYPSRPFLIRGNGAILDGSWRVPSSAWRHVKDDIFRFQPPRTAFQQLFVDDMPVEKVAVDAATHQLPELQPLNWCLFDRHIYFRPEEDKLPQFYNLTFAGLQTGVTLYKCERVIIEDLIVQGFQLDGINAHDGVFDSQLLRVTSRGNGRSGVSIGGASRVKLDSCVMGNNGAAQIRTEGWSAAELVDVELIDSTAPGVVRDGGRVTVNGVKLPDSVRIYPEPAAQGEVEDQAEGRAEAPAEADALEPVVFE